MARIIKRLPREPEVEAYALEDTHATGTTSIIAKLTKTEDGHTEWDEMEPIPQPPPKEIQVMTSLIELQKDDLAHYEMTLQMLKQGCRRSHLSIDEICKLSITTAKILENRRTLLFPNVENNGRKKLTAYDA
jgi:hypothetical protein